MTYLDRLISRALATPRPADAAVFDPFEQVAEWPLDPATPTAIAPVRDSAVEPVMPAPPIAANEPAAAPIEMKTTSLVEPPLPAQQTADPVEATLHQEPITPTTILPSAPMAMLDAIAPEPAAPARTPLEISTEFMRRIAPDLVPKPDPEPTAQQTPSTVVTPALADVPINVSPIPQRVREPTVAESVATITTIVPPTQKAYPPTLAPAGTDSPAAPQRRVAAPSPLPAAARPDRPRPPPPTFGAVERTVAIRRGTPARDDLAYGVGIMRFGIGQG